MCAQYTPSCHKSQRFSATGVRPQNIPVPMYIPPKQEGAEQMLRAFVFLFAHHYLAARSVQW